MSQFKHIKKIASLVLVFAMVLLLVSCTSSTKVPYGDISDNKYLTVGDGVTITEKELYDGLRKQSATTLAGIIDEYLFADEILVIDKLLSTTAASAEDQVDLSQEDAILEFDNLVNEFIFGTKNVKQIRTLGDLRTQVSIEKFVDSMYLLNNTVDKVELSQQLTTKVDHILTADLDEDDMLISPVNYFTVDLLRSNYKLRIAQRLYAIKQLAVDVLDEDAAEFVKDSHVIDYYKNNERNRQDVQAFVFKFRHAAEATAVLRSLSIKADGAGNWYRIPNLLDPVQADEIITNTDSTYQYARKILDELSIEANDDGEFTFKQYIKFYAAYAPSKNRNKDVDGNADVELPASKVIELFVEAYNTVNPTKMINPVVDYNFELAEDTFEYKDGSKFNVDYTYEELSKLGSGIRSYIYDTLEVSDNGEKSFSSLRSSGASRYLIVKLGESEEVDLLHEDKDEDGNEQWIENLTDDQKALIDQYREDLIANKLTSDYISKKVSTLHEEADLEIFDEIIRSHYEDNYEYSGKTKNKDGDVIATINGNEITARQLFDKMETSFGVNLALDLAINKVLLETQDDVLTKEDNKKFEQDFRNLMNSFSRDEFAQAGFPSSVGRAKFLMSIFGATSNKEAVELGFVIPKLREEFSLDYHSHYDNFYEKLAELTNIQYNNFKSVSVSHLLIYFDSNGDGTPDNPQEYLDELSAADKELVLDGIVELMIGDGDSVAGIYDELASDVDIADIKGGLGLLAGEVNSSGRVPLNNNTRSKWNEFAQLGIHVKFEDIGEITNTSNFITGSSTLDPVFYNRAMFLHDEIISRYDEAKSNLDYLDFYQNNSIKPAEFVDVIKDGVTTQELSDKTILPLDRDGLEMVKSDFGFHFILVNGVGAKEHFDYDESDDRNKNYELVLEKDTDNEKVINIYNENSEISESQIEYYIEGKKDDKGAALPTSVNRAFTKHFDPVFTKYNDNEFMQRELFFKHLAEKVVKLYDKAGNEIVGDTRFETIRDINKRQFFDYIAKTDDVNHKFDANYDLLYGDWFTILER